MKPETLMPGMYVITKTLVNPKPDRRKTCNFGAQIEWKKGTRVAVAAGLFDSLDIFPPGTYSFNGVTGRRGCDRNHPGWLAVIEALEPVEITDEEWLKLNCSTPHHTLVRLMKAGKLSRADIESVKRKTD
jgi:hypothetical protein